MNERTAIERRKSCNFGVGLGDQDITIENPGMPRSHVLAAIILAPSKVSATRDLHMNHF